MFELYCTICQNPDILAQYLEWLDIGGQPLYGDRETAEQWYHSLLQWSSEIISSR